jgi:hypothetical protein
VETAEMKLLRAFSANALVMPASLAILPTKSAFVMSSSSNQFFKILFPMPLRLHTLDI